MASLLAYGDIVIIIIITVVNNNNNNAGQSAGLWPAWLALLAQDGHTNIIHPLQAMLQGCNKTQDIMSTNQVGSVMFASVFKNTECFFRLLQLVVNTKHTNKIAAL